MKWRVLSKRKVGYIVAILVLLVPLSLLSQPSTVDSSGQRTTGGRLAELREEYHLSQANLGEIDPASETIKLATLGMRGVAANVLWHKATEYQKKEDWTSLSASLEQLTKLQPNVISFWHFQAWNLSYNVSVAFDNYRDRYQWVIKGIDFLKKGTQYNLGEPSLLWDIGWFTSQKIGRADEAKLYRRLFKEDYNRDNWLVGKEAFIAAENAVENSRRSIKGVTRLGENRRGMNPLLFHSDPPKCQINYAEALEEDGTFGQVARGEWDKAYAEWLAYGDRDIPTEYFGRVIRLNNQEENEARSKAAQAELAALLPDGLAGKIRKERIATLSKEEQDALSKPSDMRTDEQNRLVAGAEEKLKLTQMELADHVKGPNRSQAVAAAEAATEADSIAQVIAIQRDIVNFQYWRDRCEFERTTNAVEARQNIFEAEQALADSDFERAGEKYDQGLKKWRAVLDEFPGLLQQSLVVEDLQEMIGRYRQYLSHEDRELPRDFILRDVLEVEIPGQPIPAPTGSSRPESNQKPAPEAPDETSDANASDRTSDEPAAPPTGSDTATDSGQASE
jgi:hypothetical protein